MLNVFEIVDKTGRKIKLTKRQWTHITTKHSDLSGKEENIKMAVEKPDVVILQKFDNNTGNYYKYDKNEKAYLFVAVKYLNGEGFIMTAFYTQKIRK